MTTPTVKPKSILATADEARTWAAMPVGATGEFRRVVTEAHCRVGLSKKHLVDLGRASVDTGFPFGDDGKLHPNWQSKTDPPPQSAYRFHYLHVPFAHPADGWEPDGGDARWRVYAPYPTNAPLFVKEAYAPRLRGDGKDDHNQHYVKFRADSGNKSPREDMDWHTWPRRWRPSPQMPSWAARTWLTPTAVRVVRDGNDYYWVYTFTKTERV